MTHLLFVDSNVPGFNTMRIAQERGYSVSFIQSKYRLYTETGFTRSVTNKVDNLVSIDDPTSLDEVIDAMRTIQSLEAIDGVITQLEPCVDTVANACQALDIRFTDAQAVQNSRNKHRARRLIEKAGLRSGFHAVAYDAAEVARIVENFGKPVIVKPQVGFDSILSFAARNAKEAQLAAQEIMNGIENLAPEIREQISKGLLIEELLVGPLVSVELGLLDGQFYRFMVSGRPRAKDNECIEMGASMPAQLTDEAKSECCEYAEQVAKAIGLDLGIFHIELIVTQHGPALVEVNPRLMGGVMPSLYENVTGDCILEHLIDIHLGNPPAWGGCLPSSAITTRKLMPKVDAQLPKSFDLSWLFKMDDVIQFDPYKLEPGAPVKMHDILARFQVKHDSMLEADRHADTYLAKIAKELRIELFE
ncbi:ATP-grasp domain-containing protein [Cognatiyoonia sp. IB215182]|uniref:ATP-grasp domain-containing protein n=1 Tax=Cognatiyoonia sp. IB215182 TaxID=3097353 RepID=UPI002A1711C2|nr:ATP-grasp domain-containing protein [Cognatiyoonia sp. IB215182]MDX8355491.1 ATP-grasp domain-containing protein [Cognatiyoonia sp. IB215182]